MLIYKKFHAFLHSDLYLYNMIGGTCIAYIYKLIIFYENKYIGT